MPHPKFPDSEPHVPAANDSQLFNLFNDALQKYENQASITLSEHPLAEQLRYSDSAETIIAILQEQIPASSESGVADRITKSLCSIVPVLYTLSISLYLNWVGSKMLIDCIVPSLMPIL
jgi:hypothetical protein